MSSEQAQTKKCSKCGEVRPLDRFSKHRDGKASSCKDCHNAYMAKWISRPGNREKTRASVNAWGARNIERKREKSLAYYHANRREVLVKNRSATLKRLYGITQGEYVLMLKSQGDGCAICGGLNPDGRSLHVDHDHDSGHVRGLLCSKCNTMLGLSGDSITRMTDAILYLHNSRQMSGVA